MKKIPTLFERRFADHEVSDILSVVTEGCEWVMSGHGVATVKVDGSCCAVINGEFYRRYDAKRGKNPPAGAIPCCEADPVTGHHPHWVKVDRNNPADKWFVRAYDNTPQVEDGTYEAIGVHFQGNPYGLADDILEPHGVKVISVERTFDGIRKYLEENYIEGIVFWINGKPGCKIKRSDFGFSWNRKEK